MRIEPETVKGFQDFLPPESQKRQEIKRIIEEKFKAYGFLPIETPTIELDELMRSDIVGKEDEAISDRFKLRDKGGRNLGLRYEFTFQLARIFKQNPNIKLPAKIYQIGKNFRDEPLSFLRFREFTQCDADIIGSSGIESEAECLSLFQSIFKDLKIKTELKVNNRKLINAIIDSVKINEKLQVIRELDKIDKIGEDAVKGNLRKYAETGQIITLFKLLEKPLDFFVENLFEGAKELKKLQELSKDYGFKVKFTPFLVRGLSYYTGNVFEFTTSEKKISIAGGGRYDKVIGKYTRRETPACGISFGLERLSYFADVKIKPIKAILISLNQDTQTIKLAQKIRKENISCTISFDKPSKALEYANSYKIQNAIFIGKEEIEKKKFKLKNMKSGQEKYISEKQIITALKK